MIQMPRRSVTRFFIPLIDVLILLFCIFLLMPYVKRTGSEGSDPGTSPPTDPRPPATSAEAADLARRLEEERKELERLRKEKGEVIQQRLVLHVLEIDGADGRLYYRDPQRVEIANQAEAAALIGRHKTAAGSKEVYYLILFPRQASGWPTQGQFKNYDRWFADVAHSFDVPGGGK